MVFRFFTTLALSTLLLSCTARKTIHIPPEKNKSNHKEIDQPTEDDIKKPICFFNIDPVIKSGFSKTTHQKIQNRCNLIDKQVNKLKIAAKKELKALALSSNTDPKELAKKTSSIINRITFEINSIIANSILAQYIHKDNLKKLIKKYKSIIKKQMQDTVNRLVNKKLKMDSTPNQTDDAATAQATSDTAEDSTQQQEEKVQITLVDSKKLNRPDENFYLLQSPKGEFLNKNKELYISLWNRSPFSYRETYAKNCGLAAIEISDQEFLHKRPSQAEIAYVSALAFMRIVSDDLLLIDSRNLYEFCTKRDFSSGMILEDLADIISYLTSAGFRVLFESEKSPVMTDYEILETLDKIHERAFKTYLTDESEEMPNAVDMPKDPTDESQQKPTNDNSDESQQKSTSDNSDESQQKSTSDNFDESQQKPTPSDNSDESQQTPTS